MAKVQRSRWALPQNPEPEHVRCFLVEIPDDMFYVAAFKGALYDLCKPYAWGDDENHTALTVGARMLTMYANIREIDCEASSMQLRACESGCGIEYSTDGIEWTCIDLAGCIETIFDEKLAGAFDDGVLGRGTGQQSPQAPPAVAECRTYHVRLSGKGVWLCPSPIQAGDTVHITNAAGGWSDGSLAWYCPDGSRYLLGNCSEELHSHQEGDPLNLGAWHMALVGNFGSTFFDPLTSIYTVPSGTVQQALMVQANDGSLDDNQGEVTFDVTVCSGEAINCYVWDWTVSEAGFELWDYPGLGGHAGGYTAGQGWYPGIAYGTNWTCIIHNTDIGSFAFDHIEIEVNNTTGVDANYVLSVYDNRNSQLINTQTFTVAPGVQTLTWNWTSTWNNAIHPWVLINVPVGVYTRKWLWRGVDAQPVDTEAC
jgi:hypothetical protein